MVVSWPTDLDKGGNLARRMRVYRGPSLGWLEIYVRPEIEVVSGPTYDVQPQDGIIFINLDAPLTINLPDVNVWLKAQYDSPAARPSIDEALWIKDIGYHAAAQQYIVHPFTGQTIDKQVATDFIIGQDGQIMRLYPLNDLSGWMLG